MAVMEAFATSSRKLSGGTRRWTASSFSAMTSPRIPPLVVTRSPFFSATPPCCRIATIERRPAHQGAGFGRFQHAANVAQVGERHRAFRIAVRHCRKCRRDVAVQTEKLRPRAAKQRVPPQRFSALAQGRRLRQRNHLGSYPGCTCRSKDADYLWGSL